MATLREIRRRIAGIKSTQKITKAMKMVAAAKLRRAQEAIFAARPYARKMNDILSHLVDTENASHPFFVERPLQRVAVVVIAGERGLCGAFNSNVFRAATDHIRSYNSDVDVSVVTVGKKATDFFKRRQYNVVASYPGIFDSLTFHHAQIIVDDLVRRFASGEVDRIEVVYNEFKSVIQQRIVVEQFLPFSVRSQMNGSVPSQGSANYIYEPSREGILEVLVPRHLNYQMWRMLLESATSEQGARMTAMNNATENASELLTELTLTYNKARQAGITKELLEIVSGAEALKKTG